MKNKWTILLALLWINISINAQETKQQNIRGGTLYLKIGNTIIDKSIRKDSINNIVQDKFSIYNTFDGDVIQIKRYEFYYQPKLQESGVQKISSDTISNGVKKYLKMLKPGDVLYVIAFGQADSTNFKVQFAFKVDRDTTDKHPVIIIPKSSEILSP